MLRITYLYTLTVSLCSLPMLRALVSIGDGYYVQCHHARTAHTQTHTLIIIWLGIGIGSEHSTHSLAWSSFLDVRQLTKTVRVWEATVNTLSASCAGMERHLPPRNGDCMHAHVQSASMRWGCSHSQPTLHSTHNNNDNNNAVKPRNAQSHCSKSYLSMAGTPTLLVVTVRYDVWGVESWGSFTQTQTLVKVIAIERRTFLTFPTHTLAQIHSPHNPFLNVVPPFGQNDVMLQ